MRRRPRSWPELPRTSLRLAGAVALFAMVSSRAQGQARSFIEAQSDRQFLSAGYPAQLGMTLRGVLDGGGGSVWTIDAAARRAFFDQGVTLAVMNVRDLAPSPWIVGAGASTSSGGFFLPRLRADAMVGRKWLARRQLVTTVSGRFVEAKD